MMKYVEAEVGRAIEQHCLSTSRLCGCAAATLLQRFRYVIKNRLEYKNWIDVLYGPATSP